MLKPGESQANWNKLATLGEIPPVPMLCGFLCCSKLINPFLLDYRCEPGSLYQMGFVKVINVGRVHRGWFEISPSIH